MSLDSALDLRLPANVTGLLQLLQRLVCTGARQYCAATVSLTKLSDFLRRMEQRYPILRNTRERTYDRQRGRAVMHMIVFPFGHTIHSEPRSQASIEPSSWSVRDEIMACRQRPMSESRVAWWLLSGSGSGGLLDPEAPDAHVSKDAMSAHGHIVVGEYVLAYATKREPRSVLDQRTGRSRTILKDTSTWTWKLREEVIKELRACVDDCCARLDYGTVPGVDAVGGGLRGLLAGLQHRPLFAGVRNQVIALHRYARDAWEGRRRAWVAAHPVLAAEQGSAAGKLPPVADVIAGLPRMVRLPVYDDSPSRVLDLFRD